MGTMLARTRSTRLFVVLLHLVGVSTDIPASSFLRIFWTDAGIVSVNPATVLLEMSDPSQHQLLGLTDVKPHWLQDAHDQKCLSPMGTFSDCGDATMWRVIPRAKRHARRRQWIRWATEDDDVDWDAPQGYALQIFVDDGTNNCCPNNTSARQSPSCSTVQGPALSGKTGCTSTNTVEDFSNTECLTRRRKDNKLVIVPCSEDRAWFWKVNELGILHFDKPARGVKKSSNKKKLLNKWQSLECVWRNVTEAVLMPCDGRDPSKQVLNSTTNHDEADSRLVLIQFVRQVSPREIQLPNMVITGDATTQQAPPERDVMRLDPNTDRSDEKLSLASSTLPYAFGGLPSRVDIAHSHAKPTSSAHHTEPRSGSRTPSILPQRPSPEVVSKRIPRFLGDTNPILVASTTTMTTTNRTVGGSIRVSQAPRKTATNGEEKTSRKPSSSTASSVIHDGSSSHTTKPIVRKIQINPYIANSKDERWKDPQTGLVYQTDLCKYLGHERKDVGRHTLTGVGQYTKTMLNIKVYGVAFYVSKRDVLADSALQQHASLSSEELRQSADFFMTLRRMKHFSSSIDGPAGSFDRTLFLKTNMQLSTDTMRSSLDADWKMLTQEAKDLLIGSSMKEQPAGPQMLEIIQSSDNPSRCSCAQIAPAEYNADPTCCARGTELVFTWRKNGDLEVRLNGVFLDSFPRPDIAEGIFFEYLRLDYPMSYDFLDRVVDGFPFLLAPLSQVKGVATPVIVPSTPHHGVSPSSSNAVIRTIGGVTDAISAQAASLADFLQSGAHELSATTLDKVRSVGTAARNLGEEVERRRDLIGKHVSAFTHQALSSFYPKDQKSLSIPFPGWITETELSKLSGQVYADSSIAREEEGTGFGRLISRFLGTELASNATQKFFFGLVHLYLLLLLIASFPAQWTTRTCIRLHRRKVPRHSTADSDNSDSDESGAYSVDVRDAMTTEKESQIKKSLSYVL